VSGSAPLDAGFDSTSLSSVTNIVVTILPKFYIYSQVNTRSWLSGNLNCCDSGWILPQAPPWQLQSLSITRLLHEIAV
jgi:hypothetical protein